MLNLIKRSCKDGIADWSRKIYTSHEPQNTLKFMKKMLLF